MVDNTNEKPKLQGPYSFIVQGSPKVMPKKAKGKHGNVYGRDTSGAKAAWKEMIKLTAIQFMRERGLKCIPKPCPFSMKLAFYLQPSKINTLEFPSSIPDDDNFAYLISNALQGVCYDDDSQRVRYQITEDWIDPNFPDSTFGHPGVMITIEQLGYEEPKIVRQPRWKL